MITDMKTLDDETLEATVSRPSTCPAPFPKFRTRCCSPFLRHRAERPPRRRTRIDPPGMPPEQQRAIAKECAERGWPLWELEQLVGQVSPAVRDWYRSAVKS